VAAFDEIISFPLFSIPLSGYYPTPQKDHISLACELFSKNTSLTTARLDVRQDQGWKAVREIAASPGFCPGEGSKSRVLKTGTTGWKKKDRPESKI